jgi:hypothetical protein
MAKGLPNFPISVAGYTSLVFALHFECQLHSKYQGTMFRNVSGEPWSYLRTGSSLFAMVFFTQTSNLKNNIPNCYNHRLISFTNFNAQFLYSLTICMLHYNPRHISSINMPIFRRTNCIITTSGIVTLCKQLYSMPDESRLYSRLQGVRIPDVVLIQFVLLKMGMLMLETCGGL